MRFGSLNNKKRVTVNEPDAEEEIPSAVTANNDAGNNDDDDDDPNVDPTTDKVLDSAINVRGDTILSLKRTEANLRLAEDSGAENLTILRKNDEILRRTEEMAQNMEVKTFKGEVMTMSRRLTRDKCFLVLAFLSICAVIVTIVLPFAKPVLPDIDLFSANSSLIP